MNNKIANKLSIFGTMYLALSIIVGAIIMFMPTEKELELLGETISEWNPIVIVYGGIIIVTGMIVSLMFKGFAEIIENTYTSKEYQKEILDLLSKQENTEK